MPKDNKLNHDADTDDKPVVAEIVKLRVNSWYHNIHIDYFIVFMPSHVIGTTDFQNP